MEQPGWYADPQAQRWWDGVDWSRHTRVEGTLVPDGSVANPTGTPAPGWYPDPIAQRWWEGSAWTAHTREVNDDAPRLSDQAAATLPTSAQADSEPSPPDEEQIRYTDPSVGQSGQAEGLWTIDSKLNQPASTGSRKRGLLLRVSAVAALVALGAAALLVFVRDDSQKATEPTPTPTSPTPTVTNPAAEFCEEQGGTASGPEPLCTLSDGSTVDAWDYFRSSASGDAAVPPTAAPSSAPVTTVASNTAAVADQMAALEAITATDAVHSEISEGPCGTFAVTAGGRSPETGAPVGPVLYEWDGNEWIPAKGDPGPFPVSDFDLDFQPEPADVITGDFTGDGFTEFLISYVAFGVDGLYDFGSILYPGSDVIGDTYSNCVWGWSSFRSDLLYSEPPYPQTLRLLSFEDEELRATRDDALVSFDSTDEIFDVSFSSEYLCVVSNGRASGCEGSESPPLFLGCESGEYPLEQCEGFDHPDKNQSVVDCSGEWVTVVASAPAVNVGTALDSNPGSSALKTDESCLSLNPTFSSGPYAGESIYIVHYGPFRRLSVAQAKCRSLGKFTKNECYVAPLTNDLGDRSVRFGPTD